MRLCLKYNYSFMCVCVCKTFYWSNEGNTGQPTVSDDDLMISKIHTQFFIKLNFSLCLATIHFLLILSIENLLNKVILCVSRVRHSTRVVKWRELVNYCRFGKQTESVVENENASTFFCLWQTSFWKISKVHLKCDLLVAVECGNWWKNPFAWESWKSCDKIEEKKKSYFSFQNSSSITLVRLFRPKNRRKLPNSLLFLASRNNLSNWLPPPRRPRT